MKKHLIVPAAALVLCTLAGCGALTGETLGQQPTVESETVTATQENAVSAALEAANARNAPYRMEREADDEQNTAGRAAVYDETAIPATDLTAAEAANQARAYAEAVAFDTGDAAWELAYYPAAGEERSFYTAAVTLEKTDVFFRLDGITGQLQEFRCTWPETAPLFEELVLNPKEPEKSLLLAEDGSVYAEIPGESDPEGYYATRTAQANEWSESDPSPALLKTVTALCGEVTDSEFHLSPEYPATLEEFAATEQGSGQEAAVQEVGSQTALGQGWFSATTADGNSLQGVVDSIAENIVSLTVMPKGAAADDAQTGLDSRLQGQTEQYTGGWWEYDQEGGYWYEVGPDGTPVTEPGSSPQPTD